jgi:hypothetical protein
LKSKSDTPRAADRLQGGDFLLFGDHLGAKLLHVFFYSHQRLEFLQKSAQTN